ncbi:hypothetical protein KSE96_30780 (plasmid) [Rhodococcus qingshengii]|nr:hypothetical protein KSE96_30780 [Rhodococcus qingshengii]
MALAHTIAATRGSEPDRLMPFRVTDLIAYQSVSYAKKYTEFVEHVRAIEARRAAGSDELTQSVARNL